jgi:hypothetical protein
VVGVIGRCQWKAKLTVGLLFWLNWQHDQILYLLILQMNMGVSAALILQVFLPMGKHRIALDLGILPQLPSQQGKLSSGSL